MILDALFTSSRRCPSVVIFNPPSSQPPIDSRTGRWVSRLGVTALGQ